MRGPRTGIRALTRANVRRVRNAAGVELYLYDEVGPWGTTASDIAAALGSIAPTDRVTLRVNSPGGDVFDGLAIYNLLRGHAGGVDVVVDGLAASAASFIAMAGETVTMSAHTRMMIHDAIGFGYGNAATMRELADLLDDVSGNIAGIYADRSGRPAAEFRDLMLAETWLDGRKALDLGLVDVAEGADEEPEDADEDGDGEDDGPPIPPDGEDDEDTDEEDPEDLVARWERSFAARASRLTRSTRDATAPPLRPAARSPHTRPAPPAPRPAAPAVEDIASILRELSR